MTSLKDTSGNKVDTKVLTKELAAPSVMGVRTIWQDSVANGLTPELLATLLLQVDQNDILSYLTLAEEMEERDLHYHSVLSTRKSAVEGLVVKVEAVSDESAEVEKKDFISDIVKQDSFAPLLSGLLDSLGKGFAVCEIMWDQSGSKWIPKEYKWRDPRFFQFDSDTRSQLRLRDDKDLVNGIPLQTFKFIQHIPRIKMGIPIRGGLARLAVLAYMCKGYALKDWLAFAEVFGMPLRVGKYNDGATEKQKSSLLSAISRIGTDAACIIPETMAIEFVEAAKSVGGDKLFEGLGNWLDRQVSKGVLGQTSTADAQAAGLGSNQAEVHNLVRQDIIVSDASQLSASLRRDFVKPLIDLNYGVPSNNKYPTLSLVLEQKEDLEKLSRALAPFIDRGLRIESSVIRDKFNLPEPEEGAEVLGPKTVNPFSGGFSVKHSEYIEALQKHQALELLATGSMTIQSLILDKSKFPTLQAAKKWILDHDFHAPKFDENDLTFRFRQREPDEFQDGSFRTVDITDGVKAVMGILKVEKTRVTQDQDTLDQLALEGASDWKKQMDPILKPVLDLARSSSSYKEFLDKLEGTLKKMDSTEFIERLAVATFKARGLGDATDKTKV